MQPIEWYFSIVIALHHRVALAIDTRHQDFAGEIGTDKHKAHNRCIDRKCRCKRKRCN